MMECESIWQITHMQTMTAATPDFSVGIRNRLRSIFRGGVDE
jgi:hypothetical protein